MTHRKPLRCRSISRSACLRGSGRRSSAVRAIATAPGRAARAGFTLLELLLVLAILVVLGGIVATNVIGTDKAAKQDLTITQLKMLKQNIDMYQIRIGGLPETLEALRDGPSDAAKKARWVEPIIDEIPNDGWGNPLDYKVSGNGYEIRSGGIDGQMNTEDDITEPPSS